jgi:hypothetical protein
MDGFINERAYGLIGGTWDTTTFISSARDGRNMQFHIVKDFFVGAEDRRRAFDTHFSDTDHHAPITHQVWNYWHVPYLYTYLRTVPEKILPQVLVEGSVNSLRAWSLYMLGFDRVAHPTLSLYVNGCGQGLHNGAGNGRWGYVFSLTRWSQQKFTGGETLLFRQDNYWDSPLSTRPGAGTNFYYRIEPEFNQLLVFDDRSIHGVERIHDNMNPLDGRVVLHGHIREGGILVEGGLDRSEVQRPFEIAWPELGQRLAKARGICTGVVSLRLHISPDGKAERVELLTNQVSRLVEGDISPTWVTEEIVAFMYQLHFPLKVRPTVIIVPVTIA